MTIPAPSSSPLYLLDTNILIHAVRGSATWQRIKAACDPLMVVPRPSVCVVTEGELRSFTQQQASGPIRMNQIAFLLGYFARAQIDSPDVLQAYSDIDTLSRNAGIRMGKNDLWIATVAQATGATLVTTDRDFEHLHGPMISRLLVV